MAKQTIEEQRRAELDQRVRALTAGRSPFERFMLVAATRDMETDELAAILSDAGITGGGGAALDAPIAGRPFHHWMGKSHDQIEREIEQASDLPPDSDRDKLLGEIAKAFDDRGMKIAEPEGPANSAQASEARERMPRGMASSVRPNAAAIGGLPGGLPGAGQTLDDSGNPAPATPPASAQGEQEPTYGRDQLPLSELAGMSDEELLLIDGIGPATIQKIRADAADRDKK